MSLVPRPGRKKKKSKGCDLPHGYIFKLGENICGRKVIRMIPSEEGLGHIKYKVEYECGHSEYITHTTLRRAYRQGNHAKGCKDCRNKWSMERLNAHKKKMQQAALEKRTLPEYPIPVVHEEDWAHLLWNKSLNLRPGLPVPGPVYDK